MSYFRRHARAAALALCQERERRAWRCGWALFALLFSLAAGALFCPAPAGLRSARQVVDFTGIRVEEAELPAAPPAAPSRPRFPLPEPPPVVPTLPPLVTAPPVPEALATIEWEGIEAEAADPLLALELPARLAAPATPAAATPAPAAPAAASTELIAASYRSAPPPPYPPALRSRRVQGRVGLRIAVDIEGVPQEVEVCAPSGHASFDRTACDWVRRHWRFHPARRNGVAVASIVRTQVVFELP